MYQVETEIRDYLETALTSTALKKYYVGRVPVEKLPVNYLPVLMVYGTNTRLVGDRLTTARDKYVFTIKVEVVINTYKYVASAGVDADQVLDAQKAVKQLMEERDSGMTPKSTTVLGAIRDNVLGDKYLFSNEGEIEYEEENINGTVYMRATLTMNAVTRYNNR